MKTLVIYAHPDAPKSHAKYTLEKVEETLKSKHVEYEVLDLYKMDFNPVLPADAFDKTKPLDPIIKSLQDKVAASEKLIFIYPVWWGSVPAILKGFFDRVFSAGFAFRYTPVIPPKYQESVNKFLGLFGYRFNYGIPRGLLKGKKAIIFTSTGGPKVVAYPWTGNRFKKSIQKDMLGFFGIKSKLYYVSAAYVLDDYQKKKIDKNVKKGLRHIV